ncbi:MAG: PadR family transcriptional regulator [Clostridia bacterium]|nr:PadR family transcriptional regulator [Clostridia bacterium]
MKLKKDVSKGSVSLMVLSVLEKQDLYGYQMMSYLEGLSSGVFKFNEGTLYPILHALEKDGMVTSYWNAVEASRMRKYYHITDKGIKLLSESKKEWEEYVGAVNAVLMGGALNAAT